LAGQKADAWHLERHYPREWGYRQRLDHHVYWERIARKARQIAPQYGLDALIEPATHLANGLDDQDLFPRWGIADQPLTALRIRPTNAAPSP
jgi:hypothetical protein